MGKNFFKKKYQKKLVRIEFTFYICTPQKSEKLFEILVREVKEKGIYFSKKL